MAYRKRRSKRRGKKRTRRMSRSTPLRQRVGRRR